MDKDFPLKLVTEQASFDDKLENRAHIRYPFTIIPEKESAKDAYISQAHSRIASTILNNVVKSKESFSIGLEGKYGIGKSTIVKILSKKIKSQKKDIKLFKFDAWTHEGDPLRKAFLKSFIEFVTKNKKTQNKLIKKHIIGDPRVEKHITRSPTALGVFFTLATLLVPVGLALSRKIYIYYVILDVLNGVIWFDTLIIFLLLGPVIVALGNIFLLMVLNKNICDLKNWTFINSSGTEHIIEKARGKVDKTSLEFEKSLLKLLQDYISNSKRKLIIVIDNLDRVQNHDGLKLFNTIQSIFDSGKNKKSEFLEYTKKAYTIIPYDHNYFHKLKSETDSKLIDYLDKTIKIRLSVPSPVYSDWKEFSENKIRNAFDNWPIEDLNDINRIYQRSITKPDHSFSPRQLILYINQIGILRNHFDSDKIDSEVISFYVIHRYLLGNSVNDLIKGLIENNFPSKNDRPFLNSTDIKGQLASILFDTTIEDAYVILISDDLSSALYDNDKIKLEKLYEDHKNHFDRVFYNQIKEANAEFLIQASTTIINVFQNKSSIDLSAFKKELNSYFNSKNEFRGFWDEKTENGFIASVNFACTEPIDDFWERMIKKDFLDKMSGTEKVGITEQQSQTFVNISRIYHKIKNGIIEKKISLEGYVTDYSALARLDFLADLNLKRIFIFNEQLIKDFELDFTVKRDETIKINPNIYYLAGFLEKSQLMNYLSVDDSQIFKFLRADLFNKDVDTRGIMYYLSMRELDNNSLNGSLELYQNMINDIEFDEVVLYLTIALLNHPDYFSQEKNVFASNWIPEYWNKTDAKNLAVKVYKVIDKYSLYQNFWDLIIDHEYKLSFLILEIFVKERNLKISEISNLNEEAFETILKKIKKHDSNLYKEFIALTKLLVQENKLKNFDKKLREYILSNY